MCDDGPRIIGGSTSDIHPQKSQSGCLGAPLPPPVGKDGEVDCRGNEDDDDKRGAEVAMEDDVTHGKDADDVIDEQNQLKDG